LVFTTWLLGFVPEAQAETMKCKATRTVTKELTMPVSHEEGRELILQVSEGVAFFENGDIANFKTEAIADRSTAPGKGSQAISYIYFTFEDGSSIVIRNEFRSIVDQSGKISTKAAGEIIKGKRRFEGIKGTFSSAGKKLPPMKGEADKFYIDAIFTYTLPTK
ncbi:MAG: hypothetical protein ACXVAB_11745, partial [Thermodesulfobacteriota bacterium]